jgi:lipopolysaccharide/colanic/teichoic acid biosynthesis glycosyltransferase
LVILQAPLVLAGTRSWVGPPANARFPADEEGAEGIYIGKPGVLGPVQLFSNATLSAEDERKLILSYAKNQSFSLDIEILVRSLTGLQGRDAWLGYRR